MGYFDNIDNVEEYIKMSEGYDGSELITILNYYLKPGSTVLELGIGPGKDLDLLVEQYIVTGSDSSKAFVDRYLRNKPEADVMVLDAENLMTERSFDAIYSNKVLHHLTKTQLKQSFQQQALRLNDSGILLHSFWYGDKVEEFEGLLFVYYTEHTLNDVIGNEYDTIAFSMYAEMDANDSFYIVLRKK